jgi:hypothetical protein
MPQKSKTNFTPLAKNLMDSQTLQKSFKTIREALLKMKALEIKLTDKQS